MLRRASMLLGLAGFVFYGTAFAQPPRSVVNLTGLPAYPNLTSAAMADRFRTETYGRWCAKFTAETGDSLSSVETWYRKALLRASETDLAKDGDFNYRPNLTGIKLALGIDYVAVYRTSNEETVIELHRCSWTH